MPPATYICLCVPCRWGIQHAVLKISWASLIRLKNNKPCASECWWGLEDHGWISNLQCCCAWPSTSFGFLEDVSFLLSPALQLPLQLPKCRLTYVRSPRSGRQRRVGWRKTSLRYCWSRWLLLSIAKNVLVGVPKRVLNSGSRLRGITYHRWHWVALGIPMHRRQPWQSSCDPVSGSAAVSNHMDRCHILDIPVSDNSEKYNIHIQRQQKTTNHQHGISTLLSGFHPVGCLYRYDFILPTYRNAN